MHRPFHIAYNMPVDATGESMAYFNAIVSTSIVAAAMASHELQFYVDKNFAKDLLRDLTHRTMSRSAIEAMMRYAIIDMPSPQAIESSNFEMGDSEAAQE
jgi:hypothetical protein